MAAKNGGHFANEALPLLTQFFCSEDVMDYIVELKI